MNNQIFTVLIRAGLCTAEANESEKQNALTRYFVERGGRVPGSDDGIMGAMGIQPTRIMPGSAQADNLREAAVDAMVSQYMRSARTSSGPVNVGLQSWENLGRAIVRASGATAEQANNLPAMELASLLLQGRQAVSMGSQISAEAAYNTSGMFSSVTYDASNVMIRQSYAEAKTTFQFWAKRGEDVANFKPVHRAISGEVGDPRAVPENVEFEEVTMPDGKETYKLVVWGSMFSLTWQLLLNGGLGTFFDLQIKFGRAMKRKQNRLVYGLLNSNPTMADGGAVFNATAVTTAGGHANKQTGAVSDYGAAFSAMNLAMKKQKALDPNVSGALNIGAEYVLHPSALNDKIRKQLSSQADPSASNSGVTNVYRGAFTPIEDEELGASSGGSDTAFYLAANSADIDTVEYAYLQGLEVPRIESQPMFNVLGMQHRCYIAFATKVIDFRGLQQHTGN